jgi:hypothetical protein
MFGQQVVDSNSIPRVVASHPFADCRDRLVEVCIGGGQAKLLFQEVIAYARYFFFVGNATSDESLFCRAIPQYRTMPAIAFSSALGTYFLTSAAQSSVMARS